MSRQMGDQADFAAPVPAAPPVHTPATTLRAPALAHQTPDVSKSILRRSFSTPALKYPHLSYPPSSVLSAASYNSEMTEGITRYSPDNTPRSSASRPQGSGAAHARQHPPTFDSPTPHNVHYNSSVRMDGISGAGAIEMGELSGIQPPATFPLTEYPYGYTRQDPVPPEDGDELNNRYAYEANGSSRKKAGAPSCNPWDYLVGDHVPELLDNNLVARSGAARYGVEAKHGCKVRRRFTKRELEALEVLWSIAKSPSKYERQRLGAWLGVKTKHITVWFQNRRQEEKRYTRGDQQEHGNTSRANRGTFDPVTGKWRPVPASCISGLEPPPEDKISVVRAISVGEVTRETWLARYPSATGGGPTAAPQSSMTGSPSSASSKRGTKRPAQLLSARLSGQSLDEVLQARESGFGLGADKRYRRGSKGAAIEGEGQERNDRILSLMPSDPPSMGLTEMDPEESDGDDGGVDVEALERRKRARTLNGLGRATSFDLFASSSRAKQLAKPSKEQGHVLGQINPNLSIRPSASTAALKKPTLESIASSQAHRRPRSRGDDPHSYSRFKKEFSRAQSTSAIPQSSSRNESRRTYQPSQLKTPNLGYARSHSMSSSSSKVITPEDVREPRPVVKLEPRNEKDEEVIGAAEMLLSLFGGAP
ncbi:hypothetical protein L198_01674 [Cryptococcus wingfieldii CBS 7118]|uniref:Homeobox domain-containing protein n=1 Tax=Cryptococcus wingfieldii CBS 7118 TaxID=1295528 RepID=A0A1E3K2J4_9TREE|nr:hypothetical protein L198_01674 [Cryptococcus wingfieldii CBS 7118]ODO06442.1 hypothetical protein L198_01674 [Cryptococcus wingfieldii CBS 7118]